MNHSGFGWRVRAHSVTIVQHAQNDKQIRKPHTISGFGEWTSVATPEPYLWLRITLVYGEWDTGTELNRFETLIASPYGLGGHRQVKQCVKRKHMHEHERRE